MKPAGTGANVLERAEPRLFTFGGWQIAFFGAMLVTVQKRSGPPRGQPGKGKGKKAPPKDAGNRQPTADDICPYCKRPLDPKTAARHMEACRAGYLTGIAVRHVDDRGHRRPRGKRAGGR